VKIACLLTCFNRRDKTLSCIGDLVGLEADGISLDIFLVDDASEDGTGNAVEEAYPEVNVIRGDGGLYWNGGMRLAWSIALNNDDYDFFLWVNDDCRIYRNTLDEMIFDYRCLVERGESVGAVVSSMIDPRTKEVSYGGRCSVRDDDPLMMGEVLTPNGKPQKCDFINGNFTLIPMHVVSSIGILSASYTHSMGDFDYGLRAIRNGWQSWVASHAGGECIPNATVGSYKDFQIGYKDRLRLMTRVTQLPPADEWSLYVLTHGGRMKWKYIFKAYLRKYFPLIWLFAIDINECLK
jgi:GT2 family glycosyltransferase